LVFGARAIADLHDGREYTLNAEEIALVNPNTLTLPVFRSRRDAQIVTAIYTRVPILVRRGHSSQNPWNISFLRMFDLTNDAEFFIDDGTQGSMALRLYEAKMVHHFNHRYRDHAMSDASKDGHNLPNVPDELLADPDYEPSPRYWVNAHLVNERLMSSARPAWLIGFRDICRNTDERTLIAAAVPRSAVGNSLPLIMVDATPQSRLCLLANLCSFVSDFVARTKAAGVHMNFFILEQLPFLTPDELGASPPWDGEGRPLHDWISERAFELTYVSYAMSGVAAELGFSSQPFRWNTERRTLLRAELDAAFFHLYGLAEEDVDYVMETVPVVKRRDEEKYGDYRTKALILDVYRKMADAITIGVPYETILDPPPADPSVAHGTTDLASVGE
jgi:hypothetical protein